VNVPKAIESALAGILRGAELVSGVAIRPWQSLRSDPGWNPDEDRTLPLIDVRFFPERSNDTGATLICAGSIICATDMDSDRDHSQIAKLYEAAADAVRAIYTDFYAGGTSGEYAAFVAAVEAEAPGAINIGGVTLGDPDMPQSTSGVNTIGIGLDVHFSYA
jgi:hypothetical protein